MTVLALIVTIHGAGLAFAWIIARSLSEGALGPALRRVARALERAAVRFLWQEARVAALAAFVAAALLLALHLRAARHEVHPEPLRSALTAALGVVAGAALACAAGRVALGLGARAGVHAASAAGIGFDRALSIAARAGGAAALVVEASSLLGLLAVFGVSFAFESGATSSEGIDLLRRALPALSAFPLGAVLAALVLQRAGGAYQTASGLGIDLAGGRDSGLARNDPRNPALVSDLVGDLLGSSAGGAALLFATRSAAHVAVLILALSALGASSPASLVLLPFLLHALFLVGVAFAIAAVRAEEMKSPGAAVLRGVGSAGVIQLSALFGATFWLAREHWLPLAAAGTVGLLASVLVPAAVWLRSSRRSMRAREAWEAPRSDGTLAALACLGSGLQAVFLPTLALAGSALLVLHLGAATGLENGSLWASLVALSALLGGAPFAFGMTCLGTVGGVAHGVAGLARLDAEVERRTLRLEEAHAARHGAQAQLIACIGAAAIAAALGVRALSAQPTEMSAPWLTASGALGLTLVFSYAGACAHGAARGARELALEVERQLRGFPREHGVLKLPADYAPRYRPCVELAGRVALARLGPDALLALGLPLAAAVGLSLLYGGDWASGGLSSFVAVAGLAGFGAALAADATRALLLVLGRAGRAQPATEVAASVTRQAFAGVLGHAVGPAARAAAIAAAAVALALAPFFD